MKFAKARHEPTEIWWGEVDAADITEKKGRTSFVAATLASVVHRWLSEQEEENEFDALFVPSDGDDPGRPEKIEIKMQDGDLIATFFLDFEVIANPAPAEPLITDDGIAFLNSVVKERAGESPLDQNLSTKGEG